MSEMKSVSKIQNYLAMLILLLGSLVVVWVTTPIWQQQNLNDDSFITLTYAKNLAAGNGFVYNHPPATLGTTTPLFTFLTALTARVTPFDVVDAAVILSVFAWIGTGWVLYFLLKQTAFTPVPAAVAASIPLFFGMGWRWFVGMEIWLFQFLLVLSIYLAFTRKPLWAGITVGLLFLTRGEGALVGVILFVYLWFQERRIPVKLVIGAGGVVIIWIIYAMLTFGTFIPNTLAAKQAQADTSIWQNFIERMVKELLPNYLSAFNVLDKWILNPYLVFLIAGFLYAAVFAKKLLVFAVWAVAYLAGYTILNPSAYYWYVLNVAFVFLVFTGIGLAGLSTLAWRQDNKNLRLVIAGIVLVLAVALFSFSFRFTINAPSFRGDYNRAVTYKALAQWLQEHTDTEDSVAFIEVGYFGYFTDNRIIDLGGLTDPIVTDHIVSDGLSWGFWHYKPDYYIYAEEFNWALGDIKPALESDYEPVYQLERDYQSAPIYIYKRRTK